MSTTDEAAAIQWRRPATSHERDKDRRRFQRTKAVFTVPGRNSPGERDELTIITSLAATGSQGICPVSGTLASKGDALTGINRADSASVKILSGELRWRLTSIGADRSCSCITGLNESTNDTLRS